MIYINVGLEAESDNIVVCLAVSHASAHSVEGGVNNWKKGI